MALVDAASLAKKEITVHIVVESSTFSLAPWGSGARIAREILPRMCRLAPDLSVRLLVPNPRPSALPRHTSIEHTAPLSVEKWLRPHRYWGESAQWVKRLEFTWAAGTDRRRTWHSLYYLTPVRWRAPIVVTVHDFIHEKFAHMFSWRGAEFASRRKAQAINAADYVICVSESTRQDALERFSLDPARAVTIPLASSDVFRVLGGYDQSSALRSRVADTGRPFLMYVGARAGYKNFQLLLRAYARWDLRNDFEIVVVGPPLTKSESTLAAELGVADCVKVLTDVEDDHLCALYNRAAAFVHPSLYEGFGIPLLEAMACGCPVAASRIPTSVEIAGDSVVFFDPNALEEMQWALTTAVNEGRDCDRVRRARARASSFSWDRTASETLQIYRALPV